ncbi:MAG: hypothetical protein ACRC6B_02310, partial [Fusobacteriaceae bacterium]
MIGALIAVLALGGYTVLNKISGKEVKVARLEMGNLSSSILYAGVVGAGEVIPVYIEAPALIESVSAKLGQEVQA